MCAGNVTNCDVRGVVVHLPLISGSRFVPCLGSAATGTIHLMSGAAVPHVGWVRCNFTIGAAWPDRTQIRTFTGDVGGGTS